MTEIATALGAACRAPEERLLVWLVAVRRTGDGSIDVLELDHWSATKGSDEGAQLIDLRDSIANAIDAQRLGDIDAVAVKRAEQPPGRPSAAYDRKVRFEASAMLASKSAGKRYFAYRKQQLKSRDAFLEDALAADGAPDGTEANEAVAAACAALSDLS